jgi:FkbM family methyltransferase
MDLFYKYNKYKNKYLQLKYLIKKGGDLDSTNKQITKRKPNDIVQIDKTNNKNFEWRYNLPLVKYCSTNKIFFYDNNNKKINLKSYEMFEQYLISKWIKSTDIVLELGGRYGIVSCTINILLDSQYKNKHVVIEPDSSVLKKLFKNKKNTGSKFTVVKTPINNNEIFFYKNNESMGLGNFTGDNKTNIDNSEFEKIKINNITHNDFFNKFKQKFNVLVADCEGCLCDFFNQNEKILSQLEMIIFELDNESICNYDNIYNLFNKYNFILIDSIDIKNYNPDDSFVIVKFQQVWIKN